MNNTWALSNINLYDILCPSKLKGYVDENAIELGKGQIIYSHHQVENKVYLVSKGKVKIVTYDKEGNEVVKLILSKGEIFGEKIILGDIKSNEYAIACNNPTEVCAVNIAKMKELMRDNKRFELRIYKIIGLRFQKIERRLELLIGKDVETRIIRFIHDLYSENENTVFVNHLSQSDISKLLGTSRESVTKVFNKLKKDDIIYYTRKEIIIRDPLKLSEMSGN
jgi:CRP-like cAMP-binding protein